MSDIGNFGAIIKVKIDQSQAQVNDLERQIKALSDNIKTAISVKLNIDAKDINLITEKIKEAQKKAQSGGKEQIKLGGFETATAEMNKIMSNMDRITEHFKKLGDNVQIKQTFSNADESLKKFEVSVDRLNGKIKETSKFSVNVNTNKSGVEEMSIAKITMASKNATEQVVKDTKKKTEVIDKEISSVQKLILLYTSQRISAEKFIQASANMYTSGKMSGTSTADLKEQTKLFNALKTAQSVYNKDTGQSNAVLVEAQRVKAINQAYNQQEQLLKKVYDTKNSIAKLNPKDNSKEIVELQKILDLQNKRLNGSQTRSSNNNLSDEQRMIQYLNLEIDLKNKLAQATSKVSDAENKKSFKDSQADAYKQQEQSLKNIYSLLKQKLDAEKNGYELLTSQLQKQIQLEGQKYAIATRSIKTGGLTDSTKEVELLNNKSALQSKYNNEKAKEVDLTRQATQVLENQIKSLQSKYSSLLANLKGKYGSLVDSNDSQKFMTMLSSATGMTAQQFQMLKPQMDSAFRSLESGAKTSSSALKLAQRDALSLGDAFKQAFEKFPIWMITATAYMQLINAFREGISTVIDLNSAITTIRMTMDMTSSDMDNLTSSSQKMAKEMGIAISEVLNAVKVYANMNESVSSILEKTKADIQLATASGMNTTDTTDAIQAILNQFELEATGSAERIADTLEMVSANMPMDFQRGIQQIVNGIRVSGTVAREAGFDLERYESVLGSIIARTRLQGSQIGNALKTVFARLGRVSDPTEASTEDISKAETAYRKLGIEIRDSLTGDFRDVPDVLDELSIKWSGLTKIQKNYISEISAGIRQKNIFSNMLDSWTTSTDLYTKALDANGFANERHGIYLESNKAKMEQFKVTMDTMWQNTLSSQGMNSLLSGVTSLAEGFSFFATKVGLLPVLLTTVALVFSMFKGKMVTTTLVTALATSFGNLGNILGRLPQMIALNGSLMGGLRGAVGMLGVAFNGAAISAGLMNAALTLGLSFAIMKAVSYFSNLSHKSEEQKQAFNDLTQSIFQLKQETSELPSLISSYEELFDKIGKTTEEKEELATTTAKLSTLFENSVIQLDSEGKAIEVDIEYVKQLTQAKKDLLIVQQQELASKFESMGKDQYDEILTKQTRIKEINAEITKQNDKIANLESYDNANPDDVIGITIDNKRIESYKKTLAELYTEKAKLTGESSEIQQELSKEAYAFDQSRESANKLSQSLINNLSKATFDSEKGFSDLASVMDVFSKSDVSEVFKRISEDIAKGTTSEKAKEDIKDMESALNKYGVEADIVTKIIKYFNNAIKLENAPKIIKEVNDMEESIKSFQETMSKSASTITEIQSALDEYTESGSFSLDTLVKLAEKHKSLIPILGDEKAVHQELTKIIKEQQETAENAYVSMMMKDDEFYDNKVKNNADLVDKLHELGLEELDKYENLAMAKLQVDNAVISELAKAWSKYYGAVQSAKVQNITEQSSLDLYKGLRDDVVYEDNVSLPRISDASKELSKVLSDQQAQTDRIKKTFDEIAMTGSGIDFSKLGMSKHDSKKDKEEKELSIESTTQALINQIEQEYLLQKAKSDSIQKDLSQAQSQKDYAKTLELTNSLITSQAQELSLLQSARSKINALKDSAISTASPQFGNVSDRWFTGSDNQESASFIEEKNRASEDTRKIMDETFKSLQLLRNAWMDNKKLTDENAEASKALKNSLVQIEIEKFEQSMTDLDKKINLSKSAMDLYDKSSQEYSKEQAKQISILKEKEDAIFNEIVTIGHLLKATDLTTESQKALNDEMANLKLTLNQNQKSLQDYANDIVQTLKDAAKIKKEIDLAVIDVEMRSEDRRHQQVLDDIDSEEKAREDSINKQIDAIDRLANAENYTKDLNTAQTDAQDIQDQINIYKNDTSYEGKKKLSELQKQLLEKQSSIDDMQNTHTNDLRKQNLQDALDAIKKELEAKKQSENDAYEAKKQSLEDQKTDIETAFNELMLNDEIWLTKVQEILDGNITGIKESLNIFADEFTTTLTTQAGKIDTSFQAIINTIKQIKSAANELDAFPNYASGTSFHKGGPAKTSEEGRELIIPPNSRPFLSGNNGPEIMNLEKGTEVVPHNLTEQLISKAKLLNIPSYANGTINNGSLTDLIKNMPSILPNISLQSFKMPELANNIATTTVIQPNITFNVTAGKNGLSKKDLQQAADFVYKDLNKIRKK